MRFASILLAAALAVAPAFASGGEKKPSGASLGGEDTTVELPMLVAPVTVNDRLYHYAYMRVMLDAKDSATVEIARNKVPYIMDAMLRELHRASIALNGNPEEIDGEGLKTRLLAIANATIGEGSFKSLKFRDTIQTDDPALNAAAAASEPPQDPEPAAPDAAPAH